MLTKRIIPCLDVDTGRVVKGVSFIEIRDAEDTNDLVPLNIASAIDKQTALTSRYSNATRSAFLNHREVSQERPSD